METSEQNSVLKNTIKEIVQPFKDLLKASRALWGINVSYLLEGITYFGMLSLLAMYFNDFIGLNDIYAGQMVGVLTAGITLAMLFFGATVDIIGVRKSLLISLAVMMIGRILIITSPDLFPDKGLWSGSHLFAMFGILWIIVGYGIYQPACYAGVKQFTNEKNAAMGYAMLYALMNLGGFLPGLISPPIRKEYGIPGVFWVYVALTAVGILSVMFILTKIAIQQGTITDINIEKQNEEKRTLKENINYYIKNFPLKDLRFLYFIFILIPVQTLFAHNWLTLPMYCERAHTGVVQENFEFFANFSPLLIFVLTPIVAAYTAKKNTYKMMILGTFIMALPTFLLAIGPNIYTLFGYLLIMTIGEAIWSPRFLQWVAEVAPKGMTGIYMGIGQFPWFLTKVITAMYSGWFLMNYCPDNTPVDQLNTEYMWFIYGIIAMITPLGLVIAKKWMVKDFKETQ